MPVTFYSTRIKNLIIIFFTITIFFSISSFALEKDAILTLSRKKVFFEDFTVPDDKVLIVKPGSKWKFENNVKLKIYGKIIARGTKEKPIIFKGNGKDVYWRGIKIKELTKAPNSANFKKWISEGDDLQETLFLDKIKNGNVFENCLFQNIATKSRKFKRKNKWKGSIEAYNTSLRVSNCKFEDILYIGGVLSQRSYVVVNDCIFDDKTLHKAINSTDKAVGVFYNNIINGHRRKNHRCADGIWVKNFVGIIANNTVIATADDGIDTDNSHTVVFKNKISFVRDDGIDIDNKGNSFIIQNTIDNSAENGILVSDESEAVLVNNIITESINGLTLRDGAKSVASGLDIRNNSIGISMYQLIPCLITNDDFENVIDQLSSLSKKKISKEQYISGVKNSDDLITLLKEHYLQNNKHWIFKQKNFKTVSQFDDIKKIFKFIDISELEYISNKQTQSHPLAKKLKNSLYLSESVVKGNEYDASILHDYRMIIEDTEFTNPKIKSDIMKKCKCEKNYKCDLIDKLNTSALEINVQRIIKIFETINLTGN